MKPTKMQLGAFVNASDDDFPNPCIYVVRDESGAALYVGLSRGGLHTRWFCGARAHIIILSRGGMSGASSIGRLIIETLPRSDKWTIEAYAPRAAASAFGFVGGAVWTREYGQLARRIPREIPSLMLAALEEHVITTLRPALNTTHNKSPIVSEWLLAHQAEQFREVEDALEKYSKPRPPA